METISDLLSISNVIIALYVTYQGIKNYVCFRNIEGLPHWLDLLSAFIGIGWASLYIMISVFGDSTLIRYWFLRPIISVTLGGLASYMIYRGNVRCKR